MTFVDTWKEFHPLGAEYVVHSGEVDDVVTRPNLPGVLVLVAQELIDEAYKLVRGNVRGDFTGIFQCLPHSWFVWEEEFEDDIQRNLVLVFSNQVAGFEQLDKEFHDASSIPESIPESYARELVRRFFGDCQDPLPRWADIKLLLDARRREIVVDSYTLEQKAAFAPALLARRIRDDGLSPLAQGEMLLSIFTTDPVCNLVYQNDIRSFYEDVGRELLALSVASAPRVEPRMEIPVPKESPKPWPEGRPGYQLGTIWDAVVGQKRHFPSGAPSVKDLFYSPKPLASHWGWFRSSDKAVCVNCVLDSPDVPLFVVEFLVYHEALHADMPNSGHNSEFRQKERRFNPSATAIDDATSRSIVPARGSDAWYALAEQFLNTFERTYAPSRGGKMLL